MPLIASWRAAATATTSACSTNPNPDPNPDPDPDPDSDPNPNPNPNPDPDPNPTPNPNPNPNPNQAHGLRSAIAARHAAMLQGAAATPGPPQLQAQPQAPQSPQAPQAPPQPQVAASAVREAAGGAAVATEQVEVALSGRSGIRAVQLATPRRAPPAAARILETLRRCWQWHRGSGAGGTRGRIIGRASG